MDIFFQNPDDKRLPPEQVRLLVLRAEPWPDAQRVKVHIEITPFETPPSLEVNLTDASGNEAARTSILETMAQRLEINLHLRQPAPTGETYTLSVLLYYQKPAAEGEDIDQLNQPWEIDRRQITFQIAAA